MMRAAAAGPCARTVFAALLSLALAVPAVADWERIGPPGGTVRAFAVDPQRPQVAWVFVGGEGLWRTGDGGETWARVPGGADALDVDTLIVHPRRPRWLFAAGRSGVFRSRDGGRTWSDSSRGLLPRRRPGHVDGLAIALSDPRVLFATSSRAAAGRRPHRSLDGGLTWRLADAGLPTCHSGGEPIVVHPTDPATVLFVCGGRTWRTTDGGAHWTRVEGLPGTAAVALAFDAAMPERVYATVWRPYGGALFWWSEDGGASWRPRSRDLPRLRFTTIGVSAAAPRLVWVGSDQGHLLRSDDAGRTFAPVQTGLPVGLGSPVRFLTAHPAQAGRLWLATGFFGQPSSPLSRSDDGGASWQAAGPPVRAGAIVDVVVTASPDTLVTFSAGAVALHRSEDGGATWSRADQGLPAGVRVRELEADPSDRDRLYLATTAGLYASTDAGLSWSPLGGGVLSGGVSDVAISPAAPHHLFALAGDELARSLDGGLTWELVPVDFVLSSIYAAPSTADLLYAVAPVCIRQCVDDLWLVSGDAGDTWDVVPGFFAHRLLAVDAANAHVLWSRAAGALWRFDALTGAQTSLALPSDSAVATALDQDPDHPGRLAVGTSEGEVWVTSDGGTTWTAVAEPLALAVNDVLLDPDGRPRVYAGTVAGLFVAGLP